MTEKIGANVLNYQSMPPMSAKKKKELTKLKEEKTKKEQKQEEDKQKLPDLPVPNDQHEPQPGEHGWDKVSEEVHVNEHVRGRPKGKKKGKSSPIEVV
jgi:hypothetical protein